MSHFSAQRLINAPFIRVESRDGPDAIPERYPVEPGIVAPAIATRFSPNAGRLAVATSVRRELVPGIGSDDEITPMSGVRVWSYDDRFALFGGSAAEPAKLYRKLGPALVPWPNLPMPAAPDFIRHAAFSPLFKIEGQTDGPEHSFLAIVLDSTPNIVEIFDTDGTDFTTVGTIDYGEVIQAISYHGDTDLFVIQGATTAKSYLPVMAPEVYPETVNQIPGQHVASHGVQFVIARDADTYDVWRWQAEDFVLQGVLVGVDGGTERISFSPDGSIIAAHFSTTGVGATARFYTLTEDGYAAGDPIGPSGEDGARIVFDDRRGLAYGLRSNLDELITFETETVTIPSHTDKIDDDQSITTNGQPVMVEARPGTDEAIVYHKNQGQANYRLYTFDGTTLTVNTVSIDAMNIGVPTDVRYSPDGAYFIVGTYDYFDVYDAETLARKARLSGLSSRAFYIDIAGPFDGKYRIANYQGQASGTRNIKFYDFDPATNSLTETGTFPNTSNVYLWPVFHPSGDRLTFFGNNKTTCRTYGFDGTAWVDDGESPLRETNVRPIFSTDGQYVILGNTDELAWAKWNGTGFDAAQVVSASEKPEGIVQALAMSSNGRTLIVTTTSTTAGKNAIVYDFIEGYVFRRAPIDAFTGGGRGAGFTSETNFLVASQAGLVSAYKHTPALTYETYVERDRRQVVGFDPEPVISPSGDVLHMGSDHERLLAPFGPPDFLAFEPDHAASDVYGILYSPSGKAVVAYTPDGVVGAFKFGTDQFLNFRNITGLFITLYTRKESYYEETNFAVHDIMTELSDLIFAPSGNWFSYFALNTNPDKLDDAGEGRQVYYTAEDAFDLDYREYTPLMMESFLEFNPQETQFAATYRYDNGTDAWAEVSLYNMDAPA